MMMEQKEVFVSLNKPTTQSESEETTKQEVITTPPKRDVECIYGSNEDELNKIRLMRVFLQTQDPSSKDADDFMIRRFLRARNLDVEKASAMFLKYLKWRQTFVPNGFISASEVQNNIEQNKIFLQGLDQKGRPITVIFGGRHFHNKGGLEEFKRFIVFALEKLCSRIPAGQEEFVVIGDLEGWGYANSDISAYLGLLSILQIVFVENKKLKSTLLQDIDESQLPEIYGGKLSLVPIQDS